MLLLKMYYCHKYHNIIKPYIISAPHVLSLYLSIYHKLFNLISGQALILQYFPTLMAGTSTGVYKF